MDTVYEVAPVDQLSTDEVRSITQSDLQAVAELLQVIDSLRPAVFTAVVFLALVVVGIIVFFRVMSYAERKAVEGRKDKRSERYSTALNGLSNSLTTQGKELAALSQRVEALESTTKSTHERHEHAVNKGMEVMALSIKESNKQLTEVVRDCRDVLGRVIGHLDKRMPLPDTLMLFKRSFYNVEDRVQRNIEYKISTHALRAADAANLSNAFRTDVAAIIMDESDYLAKFATAVHPERVFRVYDKPVNGASRTVSRYHLCDITWGILKNFLTEDGSVPPLTASSIKTQVTNAFLDEFDANVRDIKDEAGEGAEQYPDNAQLYTRSLSDSDVREHRRACRIPSDCFETNPGDGR